MAALMFNFAPQSYGGGKSGLHRISVAGNARP